MKQGPLNSYYVFILQAHITFILIILIKPFLLEKHGEGVFELNLWFTTQGFSKS